jgi:cell shape-determining protein MreD
MIVAYHLIVCLFLTLLQTTLFVGGGPACLYDLLAPFVVYLGVHHRPQEAVPVILVAGLIMDGISGGVFGVYLSAYLWMYVGVRWVTQYLHVGNVILLPLLVTFGIAFESLVAAFCAIVLASAAWPVESMFAVVSRQVLWGAATGPFLVLFFMRGQKIVDRARKSFFVENKPLRTP